MGYLAGIDLGTSSTKVLLMDSLGHVLGEGHGKYGISIPAMSYAEQDPEEWWTAVKQAIAGAIRDAGIRADEIDGISFSGQMHGLVGLDAAGKPVCPAIIHLDQRSVKELQEIREKAGDVMAKELLNQPCAGMLLSTLYWLKKHNPAVYDSIVHVMSPKDYIRYRLTGEIGTDYTDASATLSFSVRDRRWCRHLWERLELRDDIWPEAHEGSDVAGCVCEQAARETGLSTRTKVMYGCGDALAALLGNGVVESGVMACNVGTSSQLIVVTDKPVNDVKMRVQSWCHAVPDHWAIMAGCLNGGSTFGWLRDKILRTDASFAQLDEEAGTVPAGSEGLIFVPYLAGERTPFNDPQARGIYFGLGMKHEQPHMIRATLEGVFYNLCECQHVLEEMQVQVRRDRLIASGGAARGKTWRQIQADMLNMPVYTTTVKEEACHGAAMLAAVGTGAYATIQEALKATVFLQDEVVEPIPANVSRYREQQEIFRDLYEKVRELYPRLQA